MRRRWLTAAALAALLAGLVAPLVPLALWAVARSWRFPALLPTELSGRALAFLLSGTSGVVRGLATSALIATAVALVAGAAGLSAGRALGLHAFRGRRLVQFLLLAPIIVPSLAVTLGIHVVFIRLGLADTLAGVIAVHLIPAIPYATLVMSSVYATYDIAIEEQARVLGATPWQVFRAVTLPLVFPGLVVAMLFAFLISWNEYILTLLIGGGRVQTLPLLLFAFLGSGDTSIAAALSLVFLGPAVLLLAVVARHLSGGDALLGLGRL